MRVQIWSYNYDPEPTGIGPVSTTLARALHERGHDVHVVAAFPHYPAPVWGKRRLPYRERRDSIEVLRLPLWVGRATAAQRYRQELTFLAAQFAALPAMRRADVSVVVSPSFPALLAAIVAHRLRRAPWILWLQDILPDGAAATGLVEEGGAVLAASQRLEAAAYREASLIVTPSHALHRNLRSKHVAEGKIRVIENPATRRPCLPVADACPPPSRPWRVLSMGNIGHTQALAPLVEALEASSLSADDVRLRVTGAGVAAADVRSKVRSERVQMLGVVSDDELEDELRDATIAFVSQHHEGTEFNIPSKIMNFMIYGLPILAAVNPASEIAQIVERSGAGWVVDSSRPELFPQTLQELLARPGEVQERGRTAARYAAEHFTESTFAERFDAALAEVAAMPGSRGVKPAR
ncbi:MAG: glycosyltransferase family 4 protein [Vicinamibacterales bacterium]